ncbi:hypothetical protein LINPERHAP1_LOCUS7180 [Linum perenne]
MAFPSKSSYFVFFALFVAVSFSNVEVGTSARQLLQLPIPAVGTLPAVGGLVPTLPMPQLPPLPTTGAVPGIPNIPNIPAVPQIPAVPKVPVPPVTGGVAGVPIPNVPAVASEPGN